MTDAELFERRYAIGVGGRLRRMRLHQGLSLAKAAAASGGEFGAAALGAYERGDRIVSVPRLRLLATLYDVPIEELLAEDHDESSRPLSKTKCESLAINLSKLRKSTNREAVAVRKVVEQLRVERHDYTRTVFTVRLDDLRILGAAFGRSGPEMLKRLDDLQLLGQAKNRAH